MECTRPEYPGVFAAQTPIPMEPVAAASYRLILASDQPVKFGLGSEHPMPESELQRFGFKSFIALAIHPKIGKPWNFGLQQCSRARVWRSHQL